MVARRRDAQVGWVAGGWPPAGRPQGGVALRGFTHLSHLRVVRLKLPTTYFWHTLELLPFTLFGWLWLVANADLL